MSNDAKNLENVDLKAGPFYQSRLFLVLCAILLITCTFYRLTPENIAYSEDIGLSMAVGREMLNGHLTLLGPPSHIGGRHFGPVFYYFIALGLKVGGGDPFKACLFYTFVHLLGIFISAFALSKLGPKENRYWSASGVLLLACAAHTLDILRAPWHSHLLIFTSSLFLLSQVFAIARPIANLPFVLLTATLLFQTHFSSFPLLAGFLVVDFLLAFPILKDPKARRESFAAWKSWHLFAFILSILLWLPFIYYEVTYATNLQGLGISHAGLASTKIGIISAALALKDVLEKHLYGFHFESISHGINKLLGFIFLAHILFFCYLAAKTDRNYRLFIIASFLASLLYVVVISLVPSPFYVYYLLALVPAILIAGGLAFTKAISNFQVTAQRRTKAISLSLLCFMLLLCTARIYKTFERYGGSSVFVYHSLKHAQEIASVINSSKHTDTVTLLCDASSTFMPGAFYSLLSESNFNKIQYWDMFKELPQSHSPSASNCDDLYLIACPKIYSARLRDILKPFESSFTEDSSFSSSSCSTCSKCLVKRYTTPTCTDQQ